jgi:hypothetical protein
MRMLVVVYGLLEAEERRAKRTPRADPMQQLHLPKR